MSNVLYPCRFLSPLIVLILVILNGAEFNGIVYYTIYLKLRVYSTLNGTDKFVLLEYMINI